jgi:hypothetical protein
MSVYAYPPIPLIPKVLQKVREDKCRLILIAPQWPRRAWYLDLLALLWGVPRRLPHKPDLLIQQNGRLWHPEPELFKLVAWPLSGVSYDNKAFLERLPTWSQGPSESPRDKYTREDSENSSVGALGGISIPLTPLFRA